MAAMIGPTWISCEESCWPRSVAFNKSPHDEMNLRNPHNLRSCSPRAKVFPQHVRPIRVVYTYETARRHMCINRFRAAL